MPIYDYKCQHCGLETREYTHAIKSGSTKCVCGEMAERRMGLFSARMGTRTAHQKDSFQPGYQYQLGKYIYDRNDYDKELKKRGLIEMGNDKPKEDKHEPDRYINDETIKAFKDEGAEISDNEAKALISGELKADI